MTNVPLWPVLAVLSAIAMSGCRTLDVVGQNATSSFEALLASDQLQVVADATGRGWVVVAPDGEEFRVSNDFASPGPDFELNLVARPFLAAGLQPSRLPDSYAFDRESGRLSLLFEAGSTPFPAASQATVLGTFRQLVEKHRDLIGYHAQFDHYGIALGGGNMFEWAKDAASNDKDMVFVLEPAPLLSAGVDGTRIDGWTFGKVKVRDDRGQEIEVDKLLKPYDLQ